jgi:transcriptional regulator with GAF, ATPase, and Fis domain
MAIYPEDAVSFARISSELLSEPRFELTAQRVVDLAVATIAGCDYAGISIRRGSVVQTPASTDVLVDQLDQEQYDLQEGPCLDAIWVEDTYQITDMSREERWPNWAPRAAAAGIGSTLSVRLATAKNLVGGLNLYSRDVDAFDDDAVLTAHIYATHASSAIALTEEVDGLRTAMQSRHAIGIAQGMLMLRYGLDEDASFQVLRRLSSHENIKLRDVAARVIKEVRQSGTLA